MNCKCVPGLAQYETTKAYMPREPDELGLRPAEVVILLGKELGENLHISRTPRQALMQWNMCSHSILMNGS